MSGSATENSYSGFDVIEHRLELLRAFLFRVGYEERVALRPNDVMDQEEALKLVNLFLNSGTVRISFARTAELPDPTNRTGIFSTPILLRLGDEALIVFCYWKARTSVKGHSVRSKVSNGKVWEATKASEGDTDRILQLDEEFRLFVREQGKGDFISRDLARNELAKSS